MASWVMHLRIAEFLLQRVDTFDPLPFFVGNVAPDTGSPVDFADDYDPPKHITHWEDERGNINTERFYRDEIEEKLNSRDRHSFLLGYYMHLKADILWRDMVWKPLYENMTFGERIQSDVKFLEAVYHDIHAYDAVYLASHPDSIYFTHFVFINEVSDYLSIFRDGAISNHVRHIKHHYGWVIDHLQTHECRYISHRVLEAYVSEAAEALEDMVVRLRQ
jgi:hypothetical protein